MHCGPDAPSHRAYLRATHRPLSRIDITTTVDYDERDIEASSEDARAMHAINPRGVIPTFDIEGDVLVGFSEQSLMATMKSAALRDANRRRM